MHHATTKIDENAEILAQLRELQDVATTVSAGVSRALKEATETVIQEHSLRANRPYQAWFHRPTMY